MIKGVFVREVEVFMLFEVNTEPADQHIVLLKVGKLTDIINRDAIFHCDTKIVDRDNNG